MMSSESKDIDETLMKYVAMRCQAIIQQIVMMLIYKRLLRLTFIRDIRLDYTFDGHRKFDHSLNVVVDLTILEISFPQIGKQSTKIMQKNAN